jgi:hypothetical protein
MPVFAPAGCSIVPCMQYEMQRLSDLSRTSDLDAYSTRHEQWRLLLLILAELARRVEALEWDDRVRL